MANLQSHTCTSTKVSDESVSAVTLFDDMTLAVATHSPQPMRLQAPGKIYIFPATNLGMASGHQEVLESEAEVLSMLRLPSGALVLGGTVFQANRPKNGLLDVFSPTQLEMGGRAMFTVEVNHTISILICADEHTLAASTSAHGKILFFLTASLESSVGAVHAEMDLGSTIHALARWLQSLL